MKVDFDPQKATSNLSKHGISFDEAQTCLLDQHAWVREDPDAAGEVRFVLIGMSCQARLLTVIYALPDDDTVRLISARQSTLTEEKYYA